jgi:predicted porin
MKKSLIALAVLAASCAAMAQSNVTLYGRVDASVGSAKLNGTKTTQMSSGRLTTSRWGMRGSEDLGGGLKANFNLETAFKADDGTATAGSAFDRHAWVGLSGGFGALKLGKTDSSFKDIYDMGNAQNVFDSDFTPTTEAYRAGLAGYTGRPANQIRYESPNLSGFTAGASYSMDEDVTGAPNITSLNLRYRAGALDVGLGYQDEDKTVLADDRDFTVLAASYDFGVARVSGQFHKAKAGDNRKDNEFALGVTVPVGAFEVSAGYARSKAKNAAGGTAEKGSSFGLGATYALSKRTKIYGGFIDGEVENASGVTTRDSRIYAVGLRHDF